MDPAAGDTAIETKAGAATLAVVEPHSDPAHALMIEVPGANAKAVPVLVASSAMGTAALFEELHVTEASDCKVLPLNVPVAMKRCAAPAGMFWLMGLTEIEINPGGVYVAGSYCSTLDG
jgi:hypothetical protein